MGWSYQLAANFTTNRQVDNYVSGSVYESKFGPRWARAWSTRSDRTPIPCSG